MNITVMYFKNPTTALLLQVCVLAVPPSGQPLWPFGVVMCWAINHVGVDSTQ